MIYCRAIAIRFGEMEIIAFERGIAAWLRREKQERISRRVEQIKRDACGDIYDPLPLPTSSRPRT